MRTATSPLSDFKAMVREQFYMLLIDTDAALKAIPAMLPDDAEAAAEGLRPDHAGPAAQPADIPTATGNAWHGSPICSAPIGN